MPKCSGCEKIKKEVLKEYGATDPPTMLCEECMKYFKRMDNIVDKLEKSGLKIREE